MVDFAWLKCQRSGKIKFWTGTKAMDLLVAQSSFRLVSKKKAKPMVLFCWKQEAEKRGNSTLANQTEVLFNLQ